MEWRSYGLKAVRMYEHGGPEVLRFEEAPRPEPGPGEVLVRVRAAALSHLDLWSRAGLPGHTPPKMPHILGNDAAGDVAKVGAGVPEDLLGQRVLLNPGYGCGRCAECLAGRETFCRKYRVVGYEIPGTHAEYVKVPSANLVPMPAGMEYVGASSIGLVFLTAWHMLVTLAGVAPGHTVLVLGAGSGIGSAAIQIAKLYGARVIATASGDDKLQKARELGADETIDHGRRPIHLDVRRMTGRRGVDVVVEHVGQVTWPESLRSLAPGGRLVTCGATTGPFGETDIRYIFSRQLQILGSYMGSRAELLALMPHVASGALRPVVDKVFGLADAADAHRYLESRGQFGKVVLTVD